MSSTPIRLDAHGRLGCCLDRPSAVLARLDHTALYADAVLTPTR